MSTWLETSFRNRIVVRSALITSIVVIAMATAGAIAAYRLERAAHLQEMVTQTAAIADRKEDGINRNISDAYILANMPPISALARTARHGGVDPVDGSTEDQWKNRLAATFSAFHAMRPDIAQIRLIGLADGGREIVRVDKVDGQIRRIPEPELQRKSREPYFAVGAELGSGEPAIFQPSYNREHGAIVEPPTVMLRFVLPVFEETGERFGMIVLNLDLVAHNALIFGPLELLSDVLLIDETGNSYLWDAARKTGSMHIEGAPDLAPDVLSAVRAAPDAPSLSRVDDIIVTTRKVRALQDGGIDVTFAMLSPTNALGPSTNTMTTMLLGVGALFSLIGALVMLQHTGHELRPLLEMNARIGAATASGTRPVLPVDRTDEIGQLATSFERLILKLEKQEASAKAVFEGVAEGVAIIDIEGRISAANPALSRLAGTDEGPSPHPTRRRLSDIIPAGAWAVVETEILSASLQRDADFAARVVEWSGDAAPGVSVDYDIGIASIPSPTAPRFTVIIRDVTAQARHKREREAMIARLEQSNEELREFAYVASHDLRAPLRAIGHSAEWLAEDLDGKLDADTTETLGFMRSRVTRMDRLLNDLLEHSRIGLTDSVAAPPVSGETLADDVLMLVHAPKSADVTFSEAFRASIFDRAPLETVLVNLVSNALKHCDKPSPEVRIDAEDLGASWRISVSDNGPGIPPEFHEKVFGLFKTLKSRDEIEGSGMGLSIVRKHVRLRGGDISIASTGAGDGTTFVLDWPKERARQTAHAA